MPHGRYAVVDGVRWAAVLDPASLSGLRPDTLPAIGVLADDDAWRSSVHGQPQIHHQAPIGTTRLGTRALLAPSGAPHTYPA